MSSAALRWVPTLAAAGIVLLGFAAPGAAARTLWPGFQASAAPPEGVQPGLFDAEGRACVKQCPDDRLPCDPPSFKHADGRCATQWR
jgi:hypothetical protein